MSVQPLAALVFLATLILLLMACAGCGTVRAVKTPFVTNTNTVPVGTVAAPGQANATARGCDGTDAEAFRLAIRL